MTREQRDELAHVCAELTDNLPSKFDRIGAALIKSMERANRPGCQLDGDMETWRIGGILDVLDIMGVPHEVIRKDEYGDYVAVKIALDTYCVSKENGEKESG